MGEGEYFRLPSQASCVHTQSKVRKALSLLIPHHLRLVAHNFHCIFINFFLSLIKKMPLD